MINMCKLLFFDTESGNSHTGSMCSFGYILTDQNFSIIEQDDIFMNPKKKWENRVLNEVLFYPKEHYENFPQFNEHYDRIKKLFSNDVIVFGHAIANDVKALNQACARYHLPFIDFKYYISDHIYKEFIGDKNKRDISLDRISEQMGLERQNEKHTSLQDAKLVMEQVKKMCADLEMTILDIISVVDYCNGENKGGEWINERKPISYESKSNIIKGKNNVVFTRYLNNIKISHDIKTKYTNRVVSVNFPYEINHFKEMLLIVKLLADQGSYYNRKASISDYYIVSNENSVDIKLAYVDEVIANGKKIIKVQLEDFLKEIGFSEADVEPNYKEIINNKKKEKKNKRNANQSTFGDLVGDQLKAILKKQGETN